MKKGWKVLLYLLLAGVLLTGSTFALAAAEDPLLSAGQIFEGDFITGGTNVTNDGTVLGDFIGGAQNFTNTGTVEGDLIAGALTANIDGHILGSVRIGANDINLSATVDRNAMLAANSITLRENSVINKNGYIFGSSINANGKVLGDITLIGQFVSLGGTYEGNVRVATGGERVSFEILPGTVIKGKLTHEGATRYEMPTGVQIGDYEFIEIQPTSPEAVKTTFTVWSLVKTIFTMLLYYLFALLLYKAFPRFFVRSGEFVAEKPLTAAGIGLATFGCLVAGGIFMVLLFLLVLLIFKGSVIFYAGLIFVFIATISLLLAPIPVSLWLGDRISNNRMKVPARLAVGLALLTVIKLALGYMKTIQEVSAFAGVILFIINALIWLFGTGAIMKIVPEIAKSANRQAEAGESYSEESHSTDDFFHDDSPPKDNTYDNNNQIES